MQPSCEFHWLHVKSTIPKPSGMERHRGPAYHSSQYRSRSQLVGRNVLIVGCGDVHSRPQMQGHHPPMRENCRRRYDSLLHRNMQVFSFLSQGYPSPSTASCNVLEPSRPDVAFIDFVRPGVGAVPPLVTPHLLDSTVSITQATCPYSLKIEALHRTCSKCGRNMAWSPACILLRYELR